MNKVERVLIMALKMVHIANKMRLLNSKDPIVLKIGIHVGPVISGVFNKFTSS